MGRILALLLASASIGSFGGCAMCCAPFDCDYPSVPGRWVRHNPSSGRVGSAFDEAGSPAGALPASATDSSIQFEELQRSLSAPGEPVPAPAPDPGTRSVVPRSLGETYLPRSE